MDSTEERAVKGTKAVRSFTWPQIRYWLMVGVLIVVGAGAAICGDKLPWESLRSAV